MYEEFSAVYDAKIREDFNYQLMARFIIDMIRSQAIPVHHALDMGCGTGNASLEFHRIFEQLTLCDPSSEMLTLAQEKFTGPHPPRLIRADASDFLMAEQFDLIYSVLDVPNYLGPALLENFFNSSFANLKDRGLLIFDVSTPRKLQAMAQTGVFVYDDEDYFHVWENQLVHDHLELTLNAFLKVKQDTRHDYYERITEEQVMYLHSVHTIEKMVQTAGFSVVGTFDGYRQQPAHGESDRVVFVLKKGE